MYGLDGTPEDVIPVQVTESRAQVRLLQPPKGGAGATAGRSVCFVHAEEVLSVHYEKNAGDPRVSHQLTLEVDDFGVVTKEASIAYGRKEATPEPQPDLQPEQEAQTIVVAERTVKHKAEDEGEADEKRLRLAVPLEERLWASAAR